MNALEEKVGSALLRAVANEESGHFLPRLAVRRTLSPTLYLFHRVPLPAHMPHCSRREALSFAMEFGAAWLQGEVSGVPALERAETAQ